MWVQVPPPAQMNEKQKLLVILGPTATGKSDLAVELARAFDGEVVSADSRQIYRGLDIGTGKITREEMKGVPHYLLDIAEPDEQITVTEYKKIAQDTIASIHSRDKLPILVGGTGFYIQAVVDNVAFPEVPPDEELRATLEQKNTEELFAELQEKDSQRAATIEPDNKRRLIRALEVVEHVGKVPPLSTNASPYDVLEIGLTLEMNELRERIQSRLEKRLHAGMINEAKNLHENGLPFERMIQLGLEYRYLAYYLQGDLSKGEMVDQLTTAIGQYAKRQRSWFKRDSRIQWFRPDEDKQIHAAVKKFLQ
ncbi:MAG: tRNA (adenosine(37)-N6)-dimethylallyltransferase MiaA [Candidatus Paceibacterota bacterium]